MMMPSNKSPSNPVRGPARKPEWAQLMRLGGDGVAILLGELRKSVGRIDGVVERLHYSAREERWLIQYQVMGSELFTVRISPGLLEAGMALNTLHAEQLLRSFKLSGAVKDTVQATVGTPGIVIRFPLKGRRGVRSFVNLARAKKRLISNDGGS